ncbi:MAG: bifunctional enoyl-CoA hydratase/phosphate acetyltransferase [Pseudomonadota bacterium]
MTKVFRNTPYDQLEIGMVAEVHRLCAADDFFIFANSSGNLNPMHLPHLDGDDNGQNEAFAPALWLASLISAVLGNELPGPGTLYHSQSLTFYARAQAGDQLVARVKLTEKREDNLVVFETQVSSSNGTLLVDGEAVVIAPSKDLSFEAVEVPGLTLQSHVHFDQMIEQARPLAPLKTAVICPEEPNSLGGALLAMEDTLIAPILIGDAALIHDTAKELGKSLDGAEIIDVSDHHAAASMGVLLVNEGRAHALMKGHMHTDVLLGQVVKREGGLRTGRRLSHIFVMDVPGLPNLLLVSDAAINIAPDLETKVSIIQNAIDLAVSIGIEMPKVGVLSAVETVNPKMPSTLDAAALSKMAERGQIKGGVVDGPLAMDNAIDMGAARTKGIKSLVAGQADILIPPNIESANMLAKELTFVAHAEGGGIVMGAKCPIILTSRSDNDKTRLASCAVAALYVESLRR